MTFVSHAQNFEDLILWRALKNVENGFYIDLGAAWPSYHSVTKAFYDAGWNGLNVEPNPVLLRELNRARIRDTNLGVIIGEGPGEAALNVMSNAGLSTVSDEVAESHERSGFERHRVLAPMMTLRAICDLHCEKGAPIHFLKIDVEGSEAAALKSNDWTRFRPWVVLVESMEPMSQIPNHHLWEPILTDANYHYVYCDGLNRYYISAEKYDLLAPSFTYPPNLFDDYMSVEQQKAIISTHQLQVQLEDLRVQKQAIEIALTNDLAKQICNLEAKVEYLTLQIRQMEISQLQSETNLQVQIRSFSGTKRTANTDLGSILKKARGVRNHLAKLEGLNDAIRSASGKLFFQPDDGSDLCLLLKTCIVLLDDDRIDLVYPIVAKLIFQYSRNITVLEIFAKTDVVQNFGINILQLADIIPNLFLGSETLAVALFDALIISDRFHEAFIHAFNVSKVKNYKFAFSYIENTLDLLLRVDNLLEDALCDLDIDDQSLSPIERILHAFS